MGKINFLSSLSSEPCQLGLVQKDGNDSEVRKKELAYLRGDSELKHVRKHHCVHSTKLGFPFIYFL